MTTDGFILMSSTSEEPYDTCKLSYYGCCPDGVTEAVGHNFEGCLGVDFDNCTGTGNDTGKIKYIN